MAGKEPPKTGNAPPKAVGKTDTKPAAAPKVVKPPKEVKAKIERFFMVPKLPDADVKMPPQQRFILTTVHAELEVTKKQKTGLTRKEILLLLEAKGLVTRQTPGHIFNFYLKPMLDGGFLTDEKREIAPEAKAA